MTHETERQHKEKKKRITTILTKEERRKLSLSILGHGNLKKTLEGTGLDQMTLKRAIAKFGILDSTATRIRKYLNPIDKPKE